MLINEYYEGRVQFSTKAPEERTNEHTHLCELWPRTAHDVDVHQVRLRPERPEARRLERGPPVGKVLKMLPAVARVDLELELADGKHVPLGECAEERRERVEFSALDVDLEDVDERVS